MGKRKKTSLDTAKARYLRAEKLLKDAMGTPDERAARMRRLMQARNYLKAQRNWCNIDPEFEAFVAELDRNTFKARKQREAVSVAAGRTDFYKSMQWRNLRYEALKREGRRCQCCGITPDQGAILHVDHIKPRSTHPHLSLDKSNLQILCEDCNLGKSNRDQNDYRQSTRIGELERELAEKDEYIAELLDTIALIESPLGSLK